MKDVLVVSQLSDGALSVSAPKELTVELLEELAAAVLRSLLSRGANILRILYKLRTAEVQQSGAGTPPVVIT